MSPAELTPPWLSPLARRYALRMCGLTLLLLLASGLLEMGFSYRDSRAHVAELQAAQVVAAAREIRNYLNVIETGLKDVAKLPWGTKGFDTAMRREEFYRLLQRLPAVVELKAFGAEGYETLAVSRSQPDRLDSGRPLAEAGFARVWAEQPIRYGETFFAPDQSPSMRVAAYDGIGAIVALVDLRFLSEVVARIDTTEGRRAYVVDGTGHVVAHSHASDVLNRLNLGNSGALDAARSALAAGTSPFGLATQGVSGDAVMLSAAPVAGTLWLMLVEQRRDEALAPVFATLGRTLTLMIVGGGLAALLGVLFARRMAAPIVELKMATTRIVSGRLDLDVPVPYQSSRQDEVADLAGDLNQLTQHLRDLYLGLEAKVESRTAELEERKDEAERANAAKTRFLAAASHDLRQPMHSISLLLGVLQSRLTTPAQQELAEKIQSSVTTMENLFGNLLDISKLDAGAVQARIEDVDLGALLQRLELTWAPQATDKGLRLKVHPTQLWVRGDAALLERCVGNLIANAVRYTREGGVLVGCRRRGDEVVLQVWDTGPGIASEHRESIFEEFFRINAPGTSQEKGLGLGLSIVQRCARLQGHTLSLSSSVGRGSVFCLRMPLSPVQKVLRAPRGAPSLSSDFGALEALSGSFVVVVDDEATNADALVDALQVGGCHVVAAASCAQVLERLEAHLRTPDLIVTDYQLGEGRDGFEVIERLRQHYDAAIPALLVTANTDAGLISKSSAAGARLLHKPIGLPRLLDAMREVLRAAPPG